MPSDLQGLLVFIALLAPGFCHLLASERQLRPGTATPSALREVASIGLVSVVANTAVLGVYLWLERADWIHLPNLESFLFGNETKWSGEFATGLACCS